MRLLIFIVCFCSCGTAYSQAKQISISKQIPLIQQLCRAFEKDGRNEIVVTILDENPVKDSSCAVCRSLFSVFETACKSRYKPRKKKGDESLPSTPKQRDPHPEVMRLSALIIESFSKDEKNLSQYRYGMDKLTQLLAGSYQNRSIAEIEYFTTVREYLMSAFPEIEEREEEDETTQAKPTVDVGSLFE